VRTILRNGGRFLSEEFIPERGEVVQRYALVIPAEAGTTL